MIFELPKILVFTVLVCCLSHSTTSNALGKDICTKHLHTLAAKQAQFVRCSTNHSVPVNLCINCEEPYTEMLLAYDDLRSLPNCTEKYFDKDRINIVATTQSILAGLWSKAYCQDCFVTNNSYVFGMKGKTLDDCLTNKKNAGKECVACLRDYTDLNRFYVNLDQNNNGEVCYDIQDSMNRTRMNWSKNLGCCHREFQMTLFIVLGSIVTLLPVVFYSSMIALTKRKERNHTILIEDNEFNEPSSASTVPAARKVIKSKAALNSSQAPAPAAEATTTQTSVPNPNNQAAAAAPPVQRKKAKFDVDVDSDSFDSDSDNEYTNTKAQSLKNVNKND